MLSSCWKKGSIKVSHTGACPVHNEARPNFDAVLDDRDEMADHLCAEVTDEQTIADHFCGGLTDEQTFEANETYELLWTFGADASVERTTVAEQLSHHRGGSWT